jgi:hypothetical protein
MSDITPKELTALKLRFYDELICDPKLSAMDLRIAWLLLSRYLNGKSLVAWPSAETLARDLGSSVSGVRRSIQRLTTEGGWFKIKKGGGRRHSNVYSANFKRVAATLPFEAETVAPPPLNGGVPVPETVAATLPKYPLSKPIEEPFEGRDACAANQKEARQGEMLMAIDGGHQPNLEAWESEVLISLMKYNMPEDAARRCLREWCDHLGTDKALSRMQRILHEGPNSRGFEERMLDADVGKVLGRAEVA